MCIRDSNDCANAVLAIGGRPIMAEHPAEVADIASSAAALTVSLGNITDARAESMFLAGKAIKRMNNTENGKRASVILSLIHISPLSLLYPNDQ